MPSLALGRVPFAAAALLLGLPQAMAHARLKPTANAVNPRSTQSDLKVPAPCGTATVSEAKRTTLQKATQITIKWEETIHHDGSFVIEFSPNGTTGWESNVLHSEAHNNDNGEAAITYGNEATYIQFSAPVTLPDMTCDTCAIRLKQIMTRSGTIYYSCADIKLQADAPAADGTGGDGTADGTADAGSDTGTASGEGGTDEGPVATESSEKPETPKGVTVKLQKEAPKK